MEHLIKYKSLSESLSKEQCQTLLPKIIQTVGIHAIFSGLFHYFGCHLDQNNIKHQLQKINEEMYKTAGDKSVPLSSPKIDEISEPLINKICSYLDFKSYSRFQRCNRSILIAAISPLPILTIDTDKISRYIKQCENNAYERDINVEKFRKISSLRICFGFSNLKILSFHFPNLSELAINGCGILALSESKLLSDIINLNNINFQQIQTLYLRITLKSESIAFMHNILQKIDTLQYLLINNDHKLHFTANNSHCLQKLKGIGFHDSHSEDIPDIYSNIFEFCPSALLSVHIDQCSNASINSIDFRRFADLKELCWTSDYDSDKLIDIITNFKHLQRVKISTFAFPVFGDHWRWKLKLTGPFLSKLFAMDKLEYIELQFKDYRASRVIKLIQNALILNKKDRLKLVIRLIDDTLKQRFLKDLCVNLEELITAIKASVSKDWMFIFHTTQLDASIKTDIKQLLKTLKHKQYQAEFVKTREGGWLTYLAVSSVECLFNGYDEHWMMKCPNCHPYHRIQL